MCKEQLLMERRLRGWGCANSDLRVASQRGYRLGIGRVLKPNDNLDASMGVLTDPSNQLIARAKKCRRSPQDRCALEQTISPPREKSMFRNPGTPHHAFCFFAAVVNSSEWTDYERGPRPLLKSSRAKSLA